MSARQRPQGRSRTRGASASPHKAPCVPTGHRAARGPRFRWRQPPTALLGRQVRALGGALSTLSAGTPGVGAGSDSAICAAESADCTFLAFFFSFLSVFE